MEQQPSVGADAAQLAAVNASLTAMVAALQEEIASLQKVLHRKSSSNKAEDNHDSSRRSSVDTTTAAVHNTPRQPIDLSAEETTTLEELGECAICFDPITIAAIGSCHHHFCLLCLLKSCATTNHCPKCRAKIRTINVDPEFDALLAISSGADAADAAERRERAQEALCLYTAQLVLPPSCHAGITVKRSKHGPGVKVTELKVKDVCYTSGLRADDYIVAMNGHAVSEADAFVAHLDGLCKSAQPETLSLLVLPRSGGDEQQVGWGWATSKRKSRSSSS